MSLRHNFEFWNDGTLRCILVAEKMPAGYVVQVLNRNNAIVYERCDTDEQAAALAAWLRKVFVDESR
jgi:hypothetical protein